MLCILECSVTGMFRAGLEAALVRIPGLLVQSAMSG